MKTRHVKDVREERYMMSYERREGTTRGGRKSRLGGEGEEKERERRGGDKGKEDSEYTRKTIKTMNPGASFSSSDEQGAMSERERDVESLMVRNERRGKGGGEGEGKEGSEGEGVTLSKKKIRRKERGGGWTYYSTRGNHLMIS